MLDSLRFVKGAVARKDFVPVLTHFEIADGHILGFNGALALFTPIDIDLECKPAAITFIKAIETCQDEAIALHMTATGRLSIKSGKFKAFIKCTEDEFPIVKPEGEVIVLPDTFMENIKELSIFMAEDASRPWSRGILFRGNSAFATNNIIVAEKWIGYDLGIELNVPAMAIKELLRIKMKPLTMQVCDNSITFHFEGGRWLKSQLCDIPWPNLKPVFESDRSDIPVAPVPEGFFEAVEMLKAFGDDIGRAYFSVEGITTSPHPDEGVGVDLEGLPDCGCYSIKPLLMLQGAAQTIDFAAYPMPCRFFGDKLRGVIVGIKID